MNENNFKLINIVKKSLLNYDIQNNKYSEIINSKQYSWDKEDTVLKFTDLNRSFKFNILGVFDNSNKIWIWGWLFPQYPYSYIIYVKKLLDYGIKLQDKDTRNSGKLNPDTLWLKSQLVNSRFLLEDSIQLDIHISIASYLLKDNFDFVYKVNKYLSGEENDDNKLIIYYLLKEI